MPRTPYNIRNLFLFLIAVPFFLTSCLGNTNSTSPKIDQSLLEKINTFGDLSTFSSKIDSSNLKSLIQAPGAYTIFVPTNEAFSRLSPETLDTLSKEELTSILAYHVTDTAMVMNSFSRNRKLKSLHGDTLHFFNFNQRLFINGSQLVAGNYRATNGVFHAINSVLLPDSYLTVMGIISKRYALITMNSGLTSTNLTDTLQTNTEDGFTVFAPSNSAFQQFSASSERALKDTLQYHIIAEQWKSENFGSSQMLTTLNGQQLKVETDGTAITINDSIKVTQKDLAGRNGVVHIVDGILIPPSQ